MTIAIAIAILVVYTYGAICAVRGVILDRDPRDAASWILWRRDGWRRRDG